MRLPSPAIAAACIALAQPAAAADSAYTKIDFDVDCRQVEEFELGGSWVCKGYRGVQIRFSEGDLRQSAFYGDVGSWYEAGAFESFSAFNHAGPTVDWRLDGGRPLAAIRRWFVASGYDDAGNPLPEIQVLVVSRVGQPADGEACVVGYVEATANPDANAIARKVADEEARYFACRYAEPMWHGQRRSSVEPMRSFNEPAVE